MKYHDVNDFARYSNTIKVSDFTRYSRSGDGLDKKSVNPCKKVVHATMLS